jgi:hypothetical protein
MKAFTMTAVFVLSPLFTRYVLSLPRPVNVGLWGLGVVAVILFTAARLHVLARWEGSMSQGEESPKVYARMYPTGQ